MASPAHRHGFFAALTLCCRTGIVLLHALITLLSRQCFSVMGWLLTLLLLATVSRSAGPLPGPQADFADALFIAESHHVLKVALADGRVLFEIPQTGRLETLAVDERAGTLWTYGHQRLSAYNLSGTKLLTVPLPRASTEPQAHDDAETAAPLSLLVNAPLALLVNPNDHSLWLARGRALLHLDAGGGQLRAINHRHPIQALAFDRSRDILWVATTTALTAYDDTGHRLRQLTPHDHPGLRAVVYDPSADVLWVAHGFHRLYRYGAGSGKLERRVNLLPPIQALAPDYHGGLWVATGSILMRLDRHGTERFRRTPFPRSWLTELLPYVPFLPSPLWALVASPVDGTAWVASHREVRAVTVNGRLQPPLALENLRPRALALYTDTAPPELDFVRPLPDSLLPTNRPRLVLSAYDAGIGVDPDTLAILANDAPLAVQCVFAKTRATCTPEEALPEGRTTLQATVQDFHGRESSPATLTVVIDTTAPAITLANVPTDGLLTNETAFTIAGQLSEPAVFTMHGTVVALDAARHFAQPVTLVEGQNTFAFTATDAAGNMATAVARITLDTQPPAALDTARISVSAVDNGTVTVTGPAGSVEPGVRVTLTNTRTGTVVTVTADANGGFVARIAAQTGDNLTLQLADAAGNTSAVQTLALGGGLPPDPAVVAPPLAVTGVLPLAEATAFLYSGSNPIQQGVAANTIEPRRVAVVRGRVLDRAGAPLPGVTITVKDHPEFGTTLSRADGMFDLAVNGGGLLTLHYTKDGYLPVQRQVQTPWQDYVFAAEVVMSTLDPQVTPIDLLVTDRIQVAQGSPSIDADGTRQATILFPPGTMASMRLADGTTQALSTVHVRATEYTVGDTGPQAMPAPLPPTSGYTYAVELSVDEAIAAGATRVDFTQPLPVYIDNFLNFPVGGIVPVGWYDRGKAAWIPADNGLILKLLGTDGSGHALLDVDDSGQAADASMLGELGLSDAERVQLATLYPVGKSLWRVPVTHFTPWDCNWPYGPPDDAKPPPSDKPETDEDEQPDSEDSDECQGCSIEAQSQTLGEEIPLTGTPFRLHYRSDRVPGYSSGSTVKIPLSGASVPASLGLINLEIEIAGRQVKAVFPPVPNLTYTFTWDGLDAYGRQVVGARTATVRIGYIYRLVYREPNRLATSFKRAFGLASASGASISAQRRNPTLGFWKTWNVTLRVSTPHAAHLGGWMLSAHHVYDPVQGVFYAGDGTQRSAKSISAIIETVAGAGVIACGGDGGPATQVRFDNPVAIAHAPDGSLYIADHVCDHIRRVGANGIITTVAGTGVAGYGGDGGPAVQAQLNGPRGIALAPDGSLYIADRGNHRIRRVGVDGLITTVAGTGVAGYSGDGGPATQAQFTGPVAVAAAHDGSLYIADGGNNRIRRVGADGIITTVAGTGVWRLQR